MGAIDLELWNGQKKRRHFVRAPNKFFRSSCFPGRTTHHRANGEIFAGCRSPYVNSVIDRETANDSIFNQGENSISSSLYNAISFIKSLTHLRQFCLDKRDTRTQHLSGPAQLDRLVAAVGAVHAPVARPHGRDTLPPGAAEVPLGAVLLAALGALVAAVRAVGAAVALPVGRDAVATRAPEVTPAPLAAAGARQLVAAVAAVDDAVALPRRLRGDTCV